MKLLHLADLHLGKRVNGFSMIEDQAYILDKIIHIVDQERPQAVLIAGDIYDRSVPPEEAVELFDKFLVRLADRGLEVYMISGNHDSAERIAFGGRLMDARGIHPSPVYDGTVQPLTLEDSFGTVAFYLIPFLKPIHVRRFYPDEEINSYTDAMRVAIEHMPIDAGVRNVALVHQFITGASTCDSEELSVGGIDEVDAAVFAPFDYVALGHLHSPQHISRESIRYAGSPLKYSFSEANREKSVTLVELGKKGTLSLSTIPLEPRRDLVPISGTFAQLTEQARTHGDYYEITLTDEEDIPNALTRLRAYYPNLMVLKYDNIRTRSQNEILSGGPVEEKSPLELFDELYDKQNGQPMSEAQRHYLSALMEEIWEAEV